MNPSQVLEQVKNKLTTTTEHFRGELKKLRTGRAHPAMLDSVTVEAYGQTMSLKSLAGVIAPEAQLLQITPFDQSNLQAIINAIRDNQALGLNPVDDGRVVRIQIPALTSETRQQMVKILHQKVEDCMISVRQIRHEALNSGEQAKKQKSIGEDDIERFSKQVDEAVSRQKTEVDNLAKAKEQEILTI